MTISATTDRTLELLFQATRKLAGHGDLELVLRDVLSLCMETTDAEAGTIYLYDEVEDALKFAYVLPEETALVIEQAQIPPDFGVAGEAFQSRRTMLSEFDTPPEHSADIEEATGVEVRNMLTAPIGIPDSRPLGIVQLLNKTAGPFTDSDSTVVQTVSNVASLAILNSQHVADRTRVASLEGMGQAAHDLANKASMLVAHLPHFRQHLLGLQSSLKDSELSEAAQYYFDMLEGTFDDVFAPYADRIYRYARLINDLAANKPLTPKKERLTLAEVVSEAVGYLETRARDSHIRIVYQLDRTAPAFFFDELYVMRIAENLVQNAIKATREIIPEEWLQQHIGEDDTFYSHVEVRTCVNGDSQVLEVIDRGVGMDTKTIRRILKGQGESSWTRDTGTGLGLKAVRQLSAAHDANVEIESTPGAGTTFRVTFPSYDTEASGYF